MATPTREQDEERLAILEVHRVTPYPTMLAARFGRSTKFIMRVVDSIREADIAHDPAAAVWWRQNHPQRKRGRPLR